MVAGVVFEAVGYLVVISAALFHPLHMMYLWYFNFSCVCPSNARHLQMVFWFDLASRLGCVCHVLRMCSNIATSPRVLLFQQYLNVHSLASVLPGPLYGCNRSNSLSLQTYTK